MIKNQIDPVLKRFPTRDIVSMGFSNRIETNSSIMLGKPVIKGTRITVELIVRKLGEGATTEDILDGYPNLTKEDIQAALIYAAESLAHEEYLQVAAKV
jgi:uncharacterized protein (DUF433 family)